MGGMQALEWAVAYPDRVAAAIPIATTARHSAQQIAFNEVGRQAIMADPDWNGGNYYGGKPPARGLAVARMVGHITYMSDESMREKFGRRLRRLRIVSFEVESYLHYRGYKFVDRFDANSYIYITNAMDYFDLTQRGRCVAVRGARRRRVPGDQLYFGLAVSQLPVAGNRQRAAQPQCRRGLLQSERRYGHDSFLVEVEEQTELVRGFLASVYRGQKHSAPGGTCRPPARQVSDAATGLRHHRRVGGAGDARAGSGLRRRRTAGVAEGAQERRWPRRGIDRSARAEGHRARRLGLSGRLGQRARIIPTAPSITSSSQTLQETRDPLRVLRGMLRVGRRAIVAFPNFGHWTARLSHLFSGRAPQTELFPYDWYDSPNMHFLTVDDFVQLCRDQNWVIERQIFLRGDKSVRWMANLFSEVAVFSIRPSV